MDDEGAHIIITKLNDFLCNSKKIELVQQIALAALVQICELVQFFSELHRKSFNLCI